MSHRRELLTRIAGLTEISEILGAMKGLALVELRRIGENIEAQRHCVREIERAMDDFLAFHRQALPAPRPPLHGIRCVIGAERGFCGDFNSRIAEAARAQHAAATLPERVILIGEKLADAWTGPDDDVLRIAAPSVADEVPAALAELLDTVDRAVSEHPSAALSLVVVHHAARGIRARQLLPLPEPRTHTATERFAPQLNLEPRPCFEALTDHYLYALLHALFFESMLEENRQRLQHMDMAMHRLDEQLALLDRRQNRQRQEEITEEIEVILLTAS